MKHTKQEIQDAKDSLLRLLSKSNGTIYTMVNKVAPSGMSRHITTLLPVINDDGKPELVNVTWYVSRILGYKRNDKTGGLVVGGCGMDMGFHVVYSLSCSLYCPNEYEHKAAYKLKQQWA